MPRDEEVTQRAGSLQALTRLTEAEFQALRPHFEQAVVTSMHDRMIDRQPRTSRRYRTDDTCPLPTLADKLLFILTYVKQHPSQEGQGQLFGMSQSHANTWIHVLHPVLNQALADHERLPARTAAEFAAMFETHATDGRSTPPVWHDGTERPIYRPTDPEEQQEYDRGKQKCHTLNNLLVSTETCHMCFLSHTYEGKASDKRLAELGRPCRLAAVCIKIKASRDSACRTSPSSNPRKNRLEENSRPLRKRRIVVCLPSASIWNTPLVG